LVGQRVAHLASSPGVGIGDLGAGGESAVVRPRRPGCDPGPRPVRARARPVPLDGRPRARLRARARLHLGLVAGARAGGRGGGRERDRARRGLDVLTGTSILRKNSCPPRAATLRVVLAQRTPRFGSYLFLADYPRRRRLAGGARGYPV